LISGAFAQNHPISLKGEWSVKLDSLNIGTQEHWQNHSLGNQKLNLPGTLDDAGIGKTPDLDTTVLNKEILEMLTRKHRYVGVAWYQKEINLPNNIENAEIFLERVIWKTDCWIDGKPIGSQASLITPQKFETGKLKAGRHSIVLKIDNTKQYDISIRNLAHSYTDGTQIIWNGVIGDLELIPENGVKIKDLQVYPDLKNQTVGCKFFIDQENKTKKNLRLKIWDNGKIIASKNITLSSKSDSVNTTIQLKNIQSWSEFTPKLYRISAEIVDKENRVLDAKTSSFGFRVLSNENGHLQLNGERIFLRGTLDCDIYPLEGHPPMEKRGWQKVFRAAKSYGLNHIRFHSWCPPEAAFAVADSMGFYLQVELPLWSLTVGKDQSTRDFLSFEAKSIIENYGNHPSFCFWSMGNELEGDFSWLNNLVYQLKREDNRRLYTATTFTFQKGHGLEPEPSDDYYITQYTKKGWVRGQGVFNAETPNFDTDYSKSVEGLKVPLIIHEMGQYSIFPDLKEIKKYTGVLEPLNFKAIRYDMQKKNLMGLADSFKLASGKFAVILYKEEIERAIKTNGISGFQLLDLHDFPGQGTALVGLLNAFWESKGLIKPSAFREFCSPVVPLLKFSKANYLNNEAFDATIQLSNFGAKKFNAEAEWDIMDQKKQVLFSGKTNKKQIDFGLNDLGSIHLSLSKIAEAKALTITVNIPGTHYKNSWHIWVYPSKLPSLDNKSVLFTNSKDEAFAALAKGETVVLNPDTSEIKGVDGRFTSVFWSPVHFPDQPGTMGILCNPNHLALANFPTEFYSDWQWWNLVTSSKTMIIDSLPQTVHPIVRVIDNFFKNRKMASVIEAKVGKGKLILCSMDISHDLDKRIAARQLKYSLLKYAGSKAFNPQEEITEGQLLQILK
jgi:hypothetical protein